MKACRRPSGRSRAEIEAEFRQGGLRPPNAKDVLGADRRRKNLYQYLIESGVLVPTRSA